MGDARGFLKVKRKKTEYRPVCERINDFKDVTLQRSAAHSKEQASRCMDCGTPFCQWACPVGNYIPEWNDLVFREQWEKAYALLSATNNLPEITGRICPALCEYSCVLGINDDPVTVRENELAIIEAAFKQGYVKAKKPQQRSGKKVAVIGSGPAGLACAQQLNQAGHEVVVFEKDDAIGGILRYGIPDFKLEKHILDRRVNLLKEEGIIFKTKVNAGVDISAENLRKEFDAICLTGGSRLPRDLKIPGRDLQGIHFAMDFLIGANQAVSDSKPLPENQIISAKGKKVVVIGGGDTGADCVGVAHRQKAACVVQIEVMPRPAESRTEDYPWPNYPMLLKTSTSHEEGGKRQWAVLTKEFIAENQNVKQIKCVEVEFVKDKSGATRMQEIKGSEFMIDADLVILAIGFIGPEPKGLLSSLKVQFDQRGNVSADKNFMTSVKGVFAAGDLRRGQSLIVWAIYEGRQAAARIDAYLSEGKSYLPLL